MEGLSRQDVLRCAAVLQDTEDQLAVLENVLPGVARGRAAAPPLGSTKPSQVGAEGPGVKQRKGAGPNHACQSGGEWQVAWQAELQAGLQKKAFSPSKTQTDRQFICQALGCLCSELKESGGFQALLQAVEKDQKKKAAMKTTIIREQEESGRIRELQRRLQEVKRKTGEEIHQRNELIAHLTDVLQMTKISKSVEKRLNDKMDQAAEAQRKKVLQQSVDFLQQDLQVAVTNLQEENMTYKENEAFLTNKHQALQQRLKDLIDQQMREVEEVEEEEVNQRSSKDSNMVALQELTAMYSASLEVIRSDRQEKEQRRLQMEREERENKAATKVQAWWRRCLARLHPPKKGKKEKKSKSKK